jgi:hypothetical protein
MAIGTRNGQSYFWSLINDLFDQDIPSRENFIKGTIHKLQDGIVAGRDLVFNLAQQLGSTNAGTSAVQRGSIVMGTLAFYDPLSTPVGDLDGKTLILETDLAGPQTVTFAQPVSPAHAATQINTQAAALGLVASVDTGVDPNTGAVIAANVGKLLLVRPSGASANLIVKGAGTANAILGLPLSDTTVSGTGTINDGASRIGLGAITSPAGWPGGTLRVFCEMLFGVVDTISTNTVVAFGGTLPQANHTILTADLTSRRTVFRVPNVVASYEYTMPTAPSGYSVVFVMNPNPPNTIMIKRPDTTAIAVMSGQFGVPSVGQQFIEVAIFGTTWSVIGWGITDDNYTLPS